MLALIDADIVAYRCAASAEKDEEWVAIARTKELVAQILHDVSATEYKLFLSCEKNFRHEIYPAYKANRKQPKPQHLKACKAYLVDHWDAVVTDGIEADDALGIQQLSAISSQQFQLTGNHVGYTSVGLTSVICSIDKDLKMIPGQHYNFVKKEFDTVTENQGMRAFYTSLLVGDPADNIKGVPGIGKAKAPRLLDGCDTEADMCEVVRDQYNDDQLMALNADLLWIWRKENDRWSLNRGKLLLPELEVLQESTPLTAEAPTESTVLGTTS